MKKMLKSCLFALIASATAAYASGTPQSEEGGLLVIIFFGFVGLVLVFQMVPGVLLFFGMMKGIFGSKNEVAPVTSGEKDSQ